LAIAKRMVELHGGNLWVNSVLGEGSTFTFQLPIRTAQNTVAEVKEMEARVSAFWWSKIRKTTG
ncbi:MAG: hypothetical protein QGG72_14325, partial [Verrucomicrobiota bacterium]|nr:hypothetical protein [Verrucomicrobiota bacterium]